MSGCYAVLRISFLAFVTLTVPMLAALSLTSMSPINLKVSMSSQLTSATLAWWWGLSAGLFREDLLGRPRTVKFKLWKGALFHGWTRVGFQELVEIFVGFLKDRQQGLLDGAILFGVRTGQIGLVTRRQG